MRQAAKNGMMPRGMNRPNLKHPTGTTIQKKGSGTLEKVLLALIVVILLFIVALSLPG
jgi:hypothetical protein